MDNDYSNLEAINTVLTSIANTTTNDYGKVALNVYQIYPKKIYYPLSARTNYSASNDTVVMGARTDLNCFLTDFSIGPARSYVLQYVTSSIGSDLGRTLYIEYVDSSMNLRSTHAMLPPFNNSSTTPNWVNINSMVWSDNPFTFNNNFYNNNNNIPYTVDVAARPQTGSQVYTASITASNCGSAVITIPNGYIGVLSNIGTYTNSNSDAISMVVKDRNNNVVVERYLIGATTLDNRYNSMGTFNYPLYPGQSVFFCSYNAATVEKFVHALVTLTAV